MSNAERNGMRVMLVDDHEVVRRGIATFIGEHGYTVAGEACDGEEAVELAASVQPDLIIMDVCMRGMDGIAATTEIVRSRPGASVIGFSVRDDDETVELMLGAGAVAHVSKAAGMDELLAAMDGAATDGTHPP